jgi:Bacterial archaeo-eukaryotic release factor family 3
LRYLITLHSGLVRTVNDWSDAYHKYEAVVLCNLNRIKTKIMSQLFTEEFAEVLEAPRYLPCISLIMPFEPKMNLHTELSYKLKAAASKIEQELLAVYTAEKVVPVMKRLEGVIKNLYYNTHKKTIAIFVSPLIEKVYYLDIPVEEKIIIDDSFEIRDLIYCKKQIHKYLLVELSSKWTKIYMGNGIQFVQVVTNVPNNIEAYKNDIPETVSNYSDKSKRKEILLNKFLQHTDNGLSILLQTYHLPIFVMGTERTIGHFKKITHNTSHILTYIPGNYERKTEAELYKIMEPHVADWKTIVQTDLLKQISQAISHKKLATGILDTWKAASRKRGKLLIVEKNFIYPAQQGAAPEIIYENDEQLKHAFYIKDAVDDVIEKVLASGGDVEFVDEGFLKDYNRIALIEYYDEV